MSEDSGTKIIPKKKAFIIIVTVFLITSSVLAAALFFIMNRGGQEQGLKAELIKMATSRKFDHAKVLSVLDAVPREEKNKDAFYSQLRYYCLAYRLAHNATGVKERMSSLDPDYIGAMQSEFRKAALEYFGTEEKWREEYVNHQRKQELSRELMAEAFNEAKKTYQETKRDAEASVSSKPNPLSLSDSEKVNLWGFAKQVVTSRLKSSSTARFAPYSSANVQLQGKLIYIKSYVEAENSFGTKIKSYFIVTLDAGSKELKDVVFVN